MLTLTADARDGGQKAGCSVCCCEPIAVRAGETNLLVINYAPWAVPLGGKGLGCSPQFELTQLAACPVPTGSNLPPIATDGEPIVVPVLFNTTLAATLQTYISDPENQALTFTLMSLYGPKRGKLTLEDPYGSFTYIPPTGYNGYDNFFVKASDGANTVIFEIILEIGATTGGAKATPGIDVLLPRVFVDVNNYTLNVPYAVSPAVKPCEVYRLTIRQNSLDCNYNCFWHESCYDFTVRPC